MQVASSGEALLNMLRDGFSASLFFRKVVLLSPTVSSSHFWLECEEFETFRQTDRPSFSLSISTSNIVDESTLECETNAALPDTVSGNSVLRDEAFS